MKLDGKVKTLGHSYIKVCQALCIVMLTALSACAAAADRPDHKDALSQILRQINDNDKLYTITKLEYANGFQKDPNDYIVLTTFTRVFKVSSSAFAKAMASDNPIRAWAESLVLSKLYGHFEPGDSFDESGKFGFLRTEKGWILQGYEEDPVIETKHTEHADALDAQKKLLDEQRAQEQKVQQQKAQEAENLRQTKLRDESERHLVEVKNACASGQQMKIIGYGPVSVTGRQGVGVLGNFLYQGQVVVGMPDDAKSLAVVTASLNPPPSFINGAVRPGFNNAMLLEWLKDMCRVQYSIGRGSFSGYVPIDRLGW